MTNNFEAPLNNRGADARNNMPERQTARPFGLTLVIGIVLGMSLGPALFTGLFWIEPSGDQLLAVLIGAFIALGISLVIAGAAALIFVPRLFTRAKGTLASVVDEITQASTAHAQGKPDVALTHVGNALTEGVAWYSIGATRRFVVQAALGLLLAFGGIVGAALLLSQNALLRAQNNKIDQQTMVADAQKRSAFATEMFAILQEVAKQNPDALTEELMTRIVVLTTSATPYLYLDFLSGVNSDQVPRRIARPLSPERGQLIVALSRMKVNLRLLLEAGANFQYADLRRANLFKADLKGLLLDNSDFTEAVISEANFTGASIADASFDRVNAANVKFENASMFRLSMNNATFLGAFFDGTDLTQIEITDSIFIRASFIGAKLKGVRLKNTIIGVDGSYPAGLEKPASANALTNMSDKTTKLTYDFGAFTPLKRPNAPPM